MSGGPPEDGPRRLVDEARDELVTAGLLALREDGPSERSRLSVLAGLGLGAAAPSREGPAAAAAGRRLMRSSLMGLCCGIVLGLAWALFRRYAH